MGEDGRADEPPTDRQHRRAPSSIGRAAEPAGWARTYSYVPRARSARLWTRRPALPFARLARSSIDRSATRRAAPRHDDATATRPGPRRSLARALARGAVSPRRPGGVESVSLG